MLTHRIEFSPANDAPFFSEVPAAPAVFVLRGESAEAEPYVSKTANLRRRLLRLLGPVEERSKRLSLRDRVHSVAYSRTASDFESGLLLYKLLRREFPKTYSDRLRLRPAPLVKLILDNEYPRATVTTRIASLKTNATYYGPFPTRVAAEKFANDSLDFFLMRRCTDDLHPDPAFPGCIYSEMKMCLAPCFKGCTDDAYAAEVERVRTYFDSGGQSLVREIQAARDKASESLEFEAAAAAHARLEKVKAVTRELPEIARRVAELNGVMVQPSNEAESVLLFKISAGMIAEPAVFPIAAHQGAAELKNMSMEKRVAEALAAVEAPRLGSAQELMEHLAILKRWFYRTSKTGELFLTEDDGQLPLRRVVRGISRVFRGEKPQPDLTESAREYWIMRGKEAANPTE